MDVEEEVTASNDSDSAAFLALTGIRATLEQKRVAIADHGPLSFVSAPTRWSIPLSLQPSKTQSREINQGRFAIEYSNLSNSLLLEYEEWLLSTILQLESHRNHRVLHVGISASALLDDLETAVMEVENWKMLEWERQRVMAAQGNQMCAEPMVPLEGNLVATERYLWPVISQSNPLLAVCYLLVAVLHLLCHVSLTRCAFVLSSVRLMLKLALSQQEPMVSHADEIISNIPSDVRTLLRCMDILPVTRSYVCCSACFALYPLGRSVTYPDNCSARSTPESPPCSAPLRMKRKVKGITTTFPVRRFIYQDFRHWLGRLLCRPGMEQILDRNVLHLHAGSQTELGDITDSETLQTLRGPDGQLFLEAGKNEGRYVFSLCMDGFLPHGRAGPPDSIGAIYLACLNLPPDLRYQIDNLFLAGIIPGPTHPSMEQINPVLMPLIDDFLELWYQGIHYTATPSHRTGKLCKCAIVPLVCDILAARQAAGISGHHHRFFCSFCLLENSDIENLDWRTWPARTCQEHRLHAEQWLSARNLEERQKIYDETGARWSELLRLPYWDPIKFTALDPMHALFLNAFGTHIEKIWGLSMDVEGDLRGIAFDISTPPADEMQAAFVVLRTGSNTSLCKLRVNVLRQLCKEQNLRFAGNKDILLQRLLALRTQRKWTYNNGTASSLHPTSPTAIGVEMQEQISEALEVLETRATSALKRLRHIVLQHICIHKLGGEMSDYQNMSKGEIMEKLTSYRLAHGIVNADGQLLMRSMRRTERSHDEIVPMHDLTRAMKVLQEGTLEDLRKLSSSTLTQLYEQVLNEEYSGNTIALKKHQLVDRLVQYREANGFGKAASQQASRLAQVDSLINTSRTTGIMRAMPGSSKQPLIDVGNEQISQEELANAEDVLDRGSKTKLSKLSTAVLRALCGTYLERVDAEDMGRNDALAALYQYRVDHGITTEDGKLINDQRKSSKKNRVLGRDVLQFVWSDMDAMALPSWITRVPRHPGSSGKATGLGLGADEWRTFCSVNLPVTLISLWGTFPENSREFKLLNNFMDLVVAVKLAIARISTAEKRSRCRAHILRYLRTLLELFPGTTIRPNQHMLVHLPDVLQILGPAPSIWCYGFERANHVLQQTCTNNQKDDMTSTLMNRFCCKQTLRNLFTSLTLPLAIRELVPEFMHSFQSDTRGTLLSEILTPVTPDMHIAEQSSVTEHAPFRTTDYVLLPNNIIALLHDRISTDRPQAYTRGVNPYVIPLRKVEGSGILYKTADVSVGDSNIIFSRDKTEQWGAGQIVSIFRYEQDQQGTMFSEVYLVVRVFSPLSILDARSDPYRQFPIVGGRLFYDTFEANVQLLTVRDVLCHCAVTPKLLPARSIKCIHVLPLDKW